jgi:hypothetical protein
VNLGRENRTRKSSGSQDDELGSRSNEVNLLDQKIPSGRVSEKAPDRVRGQERDLAGNPHAIHQPSAEKEEQPLPWHRHLFGLRAPAGPHKPRIQDNG